MIINVGCVNCVDMRRLVEWENVYDFDCVVRLCRIGFFLLFLLVVKICWVILRYIF